MKPQSVLVGIVVFAVCSAAACGGRADKSGGDAPTRTLRLGTMEERGSPYTEAVEEFARQVEELSNGGLRIEIVWRAADALLGGYGPGAEQKVAGLVQSGELAAVLMPARAWDKLGVTSLRALQAPFLVGSERLVEEIVQSELADEMLAGLDKAGVVGLTLIPESLRHPVGFARPLVTAGDFAGATIRTPPSEASYRLLEALGANPIDTCCDQFSLAVSDGSIAGAESAFGQVANLPRPGTMTANITFFPKVDTIVVNDDLFRRLGDGQREILREAAGKTLRFELANGSSEVEDAAVYCRNGGTIAFASEADVEALDQTARPVYDALEADEQTRELIERIRQLKGDLAGANDPLPNACASAGGAGTQTSTETGPSEFPEGVYRADLKAEDLIEQGLDPLTANRIAGLATLTIENGRWLDHRQFLDDCGGPYSVDAGRISLRQDVTQCGEAAGTVIMSARWKLEAGKLRFFDFSRGRRLEWGSKPWTKID